jgi:hypothetical protein
MFPQADPIPLPAPVELFKLLEMLTVTLHFLAVQMLVGGLLIGTFWAFWARWQRSPVLVDASGVIANRLPILMTYVINLGVPPLLFAQVLYGRAIYTSSVLIGVYWISIVFFLMLGYSLLYVMAGRAALGRRWGWIGLIAMLVVAKIALIYSSNMTLMNRPEAWPTMYASDALGLHLNRGDPTVLPRWLFMLCGGLTVGGVGMMFLAMKRTLAPETAGLLGRWGGRTAAAGVALQAATGCWIVAAQPDAVRKALGSSPVYVACAVVWLVAAAGLAALGVMVQRKVADRRWSLTGAAGGAAFLAVAAWVVFRGGIRDVTLLAHGFDVWDRQVATNWAVVAAFLLLFVMGLGLLGWLGSVLARAQAVEERYG